MIVPVRLALSCRRARKAKVKLDWGRGGGFLRSRPSRLQIAEKTIDYRVHHRWPAFCRPFPARPIYDVGMRTLTGFERIDVAQHFGLLRLGEFSASTGKELEREYLANS